MKFYEKNLWDERQTKLRNKFGVQTFYLFAILSFINALLLEKQMYDIKPVESCLCILLISVIFFDARCSLGYVITRKTVTANIAWYFLFTIGILVVFLTKGFDLYSIVLGCCFLAMAIVSIRSLLIYKKQEKETEL